MGSPSTVIDSSDGGLRIGGSEDEEIGDRRLLAHVENRDVFAFGIVERLAANGQKLTVFRNECGACIHGSDGSSL